jgi:hypothetical protein
LPVPEYLPIPRLHLLLIELDLQLCRIRLSDEGEPVILVIDVPDDLVQKAATEWFPLSQGLVQFDPGAGLEELRAAWSELAKSAQIRSVT